MKTSHTTFSHNQPFFFFFLWDGAQVFPFATLSSTSGAKVAGLRPTPDMKATFTHREKTFMLANHV